jgi:hypothetical protein
MRAEDEAGRQQKRGDNKRADTFHSAPVLSKCTPRANHVFLLLLSKYLWLG